MSSLSPLPPSGFRTWVLALPLVGLGCHPAGGQPTRSAVPSPMVGHERLVAEGAIYGDGATDSTSRWPKVYLPVRLQGHAVTLMLDMGLSSSELALLQTRLSVTGIHEAGFGGGEVDSLTIGTTRESPVDYAVYAMADGSDGAVPPPGMPPYVGILGIAVLAHYDVVVDGPAHRVRLYAPVARGPAAMAPSPRFWMPPGVVPADCVTLLHYDDGSPTGLPLLPLRVNGFPMLSIFDSGSPLTIMNLAAARILGLTQHSPNVRRSDQGGSYGDGTDGGHRYAVTGLALTVGPHRLSDGQILLLPQIPLGNANGRPILNLGLDAVRDRVLFFSFGSGHVCLSAAVG